MTGLSSSTRSRALLTAAFSASFCSLCCFFQEPIRSFCRAFIFDPLERRDIQGIDGAQCLCRTPLAIVMLFLHAYPGAFALGCRMFQRRAGRLLFGIALGLIIRIIPAVAAQARGAQLKNTRHLLQKFAVMEATSTPP